MDIERHGRRSESRSDVMCLPMALALSLNLIDEKLDTFPFLRQFMATVTSTITIDNATPRTGDSKWVTIA